MAGEPSPPPEPEEQDEETVEEVPFMDANAVGSTRMQVRAGWATAGEDSEVTELALDYTGDVGNAGKVLASAHEWYVTRLQELAQREREEQQ